MDKLIVSLQRNEALPMGVVRDLCCRFTTSKPDHALATEHGPKAWKVLVLLSKRQLFDEAASSLLHVCAFLVHLCEKRLKVKPLDFDKLLISIVMRVGSVEAAKRLALLLHVRLSAHLAGIAASSAQFALDLDSHENPAQMGVFARSGKIDPELLKVVILFQMSLLPANPPSPPLLQSLVCFLEEQAEVDAEAFCKHFQFLTRHSVATAVFVAINSRLDVALVAGLIPRLSDATLYKYESSRVVSWREFRVACALGLTICASSTPDCSIPHVLWSLATGSPVDTQLDADADADALDRALLLSCLELFRHRRNTLTLLEFQNLVPALAGQCAGDEACRFLRWGLKLLLRTPHMEALLDDLHRIVAVHRDCLCPSLFALACDGYKQKEFRVSAKLFELSLERVTSEDNCDLQGQKLEYLASCCYHSGSYEQAAGHQGRSIEALFVPSVQVQLLVPSSPRNQVLVRRSERWVKYQLRASPDRPVPCTALPLFHTDLAMCRKYLADIVVPIVVCCPTGDAQRLMLPVLEVVEGLQLNTLEQIVRRLQTLASLESAEVRSRLRLLGDLIESLRGSDSQRYWQAKLWKAVCEHLCGILHVDDLTAIDANSLHLDPPESQLLHCLRATYASSGQCDLARLSGHCGDESVSTCLTLLDKSRSFVGQGNALAALQAALESLRQYDAILRSGQHKTFTLPQHLGFTALTANLFLHLAALYVVRPHPRECRYYCKQAAECCSHLEGKLAESEQILSDLESKCDASTFRHARKCMAACFDADCLAHLHSLLNRTGLLATTRQPLCSCTSPSSPSPSSSPRPLQHSIAELRTRLSALLARMAYNCDNTAYASAIDCFGVLCLVTGDFEGLYQHLETQKSLLSLQFEQSAADESWTAPRLSLEGPRLLSELSEKHAFSMSLIYNHTLDVLVLWVVFYESPRVCFRIPVAEDTWTGWCDELDAIDVLNKELLKKKSADTNPSFKREWWEKRRGLDARVKALGVAINRFLSQLLCFQAQPATAFASLEKVLHCSITTRHLPRHFSSAAADMLFASWRLQVDHAEAVLVSPESCAAALQKDLLVSKDDFNLFAPPLPSSLVRHVLLSASLNRFPWESILDMPLVRLVSISSLCSRKSVKEQQSDRIGFVINPSGDLIDTERRFAAKVSQSPDFVGFLGRPPSEQEYADLLTGSRLFLYFGHGGGECYLSCSKVAKLERVAPSLLLGCSSGKFRTQGGADPEGISIAYLRANVDYLVANLWDVTDKDIDAFAAAILDALIGDGNRSHLAASVHGSRRVCNLRFINGAAPVVYTPYFIPIGL